VVGVPHGDGADATDLGLVDGELPPVNAYGVAKAVMRVEDSEGGKVDDGLRGGLDLKPTSVSEPVVGHQHRDAVRVDP
jgi:hypothetical protein